MNCKQGDLAVIILSGTQRDIRNIGHICVCKQAAISPRGLPGWEIDPPVNWCTHAEDRFLRPIRDQPGADETLSWKDVPQEVTA